MRSTTIRYQASNAETGVEAGRTGRSFTARKSSGAPDRSPSAYTAAMAWSTRMG